MLDRVGDDVKVPLFIQGGIHGNEYEGVDAAMQVIERLALTPYGTDPEVDQILDQAILVFNPIQNPDGRIAGTRVNGNGFDLNRDFLTQSQPEVQSTVELIQNWLSPELLDLHGYVTPTLIEATTKPHNPGIEYDLWLKWNQSRIDANEAAMNAEGYSVTRPINDWCADGSIASGTPLGLPGRNDRTTALGGPRAGTTGARSIPRVLAARRPERLDRRDVQPGPTTGLRRSPIRGPTAAGRGRPTYEKVGRLEHGGTSTSPSGRRSSSTRTTGSS